MHYVLSKESRRKIPASKIATLAKRAAIVLGTVMLVAPITHVAAASNDLLTIARDTDLHTTDPHRSFCDTCQIYLTATYEGLVALDKDDRTIIPKLATRWEVDDELKNYTFELRQDVKFSDGTPMTAEDVAWSLTRLRNLGSSASHLVRDMEEVTVVNDHKVVVTLKQTDSNFLNVLTAPFTTVVNSKLAQENGAVSGENAIAEDTAESWFLSNSAGTGKYVMESYEPQDQLVLKKNANYWGPDPAKIERVVIKHVENSVTQGQMLETGAADIAMQINPLMVDRIKNEDVVINKDPGYNFLYISLGQGAEGGEVLTEPVRQAISMAVNYEQLIQLVAGGAGRLQAAPIPNGFPGTKDLPLPKYDLDKAKELMKEAGAGKIKLVAGFPKMNVYGVDLSIMMQKVKNDLKKIDVDLDLKPMTFSVFLDELNGLKLPVTAIWFAPDYFGSAQYVRYFGMIPGTTWLRRAGLAEKENGANQKEYDLFVEALKTADTAEQERLYTEVAREMIKDRVIIPLVNPDVIFAFRKGVEGVRNTACCNMPVSEIYFD